MRPRVRALPAVSLQHHRLKSSFSKSETNEIINNNNPGDSCERCQDWFYGDAVAAKDCAPCSCDREGTRECDHFTGQCQCLPGVEGERCDRCMVTS